MQKDKLYQILEIYKKSKLSEYSIRSHVFDELILIQLHQHANKSRIGTQMLNFNLRFSKYRTDYLQHKNLKEVTRKQHEPSALCANPTIYEIL